MRAAVAVQPGLPAATVRRLAGGAVDDACRCGPRSRRAGLEAGVAELLAGCRAAAPTATADGEGERRRAGAEPPEPVAVAVTL